MSNYAGSYRGGIRTLHDLRGRCVVDSETKCWHLRKADGKPWVYGPKAAPRINTVVDGRHVNAPARPWSWGRLHHRAVGEGMRVTYTCGSWDCVNPAHLVELTRQQFEDKQKAEGKTRSLKKTMALQKHARARANVRLSVELAQWIRESGQTQVEISRALGVSQQRISDVVSGKTWRESLPMASIFHLGALRRPIERAA